MKKKAADRRSAAVAFATVADDGALGGSASAATPLQKLRIKQKEDAQASS